MADLVTSRTREMNSEDDRSRSVRFGLRGVVVVVVVPVGFLVDTLLLLFFGRVLEESNRDRDADAAAGPRRRMGATNASLVPTKDKDDDDGHDEHHDAEVVTVLRAAMRVESLYFAMVCLH
jgi:hypothetical protein